MVHVTPTSFDQWRTWMAHYTLLPVVAVREAVAPRTDWRQWPGAGSVLLESVRGGRYTIVLPAVRRWVQGGLDGGALFEGNQDGSWQVRSSLAGDPLQVVQAWHETWRAPSIASLPFVGGLVGALSYDMARVIETLPSQAKDDLGLPVYALAVADAVLVYDHAEKRLQAVIALEYSPNAVGGDAYWESQYHAAVKEAEALLAWWDGPSAGAPNQSPCSVNRGDRNYPEWSMSQASFCEKMRQVQAWIASGDTYQVNLSLRRSLPAEVAPDAVYHELRQVNPSPYMGLLRHPDFALISGSPELLVAVKPGLIEARPIAGTRPRGQDTAADARLAGELLAHPKERAEHLMLVDLIRNDLGRVAAPGTVQVTDFMVGEAYSHVQHIVSHVVGVWPENGRIDELLRAVFPGGTITGAPKVRTMEIIEALEPVRRGFYTGGMGWLGADGRVVLNILIRTLVMAGGWVHGQAGAGIVADSVPEQEYEECLNKAKAAWVAWERARSLPTNPGF